MPCEASLPRVRVACGVLRRSDGAILIAQRPPGKLAAGAWEFPGGKIESGEPAEAALVRELEEELGVQVQALERLLCVTHAYRDRVVILDTFVVHRFTGHPRGREGQALRWVDVASLRPDSLLAADWPIVLALRAPRDYVFTPADAELASLLAGLPALPRPCWLRLRLPGRTDEAYAQIAAALRGPTRELGIALILDRDPEQVVDLGADGWHATTSTLSQLRVRPVSGALVFAVSAHGPADIARARTLGADAVVFGPVRETPTHPGHRGVGWGALAGAVEGARGPVFAIGGLDASHAAAARAAGAHGLAGISAYWSRGSSSGSAGSAGSV